MPNPKKSKGAGMTENEKLALKTNILLQFPNLKTFDEELEFLINEYNKDKKYIKRLVEKSHPSDSLVEDTKAEMRTIKPDDPEYVRIMNALDEAKKKHEQEIEDGYEREQLQKKISNDCNIDNVPVQA